MALRRFPEITYVPDRDIFLETLCRDKVVLNLGCASALHGEAQIAWGRHLHTNLVGVAKEIYGVDKSEEAIRTLQGRHQMTNLFVADVEHLDLPIDIEFDIVVAGELIEHLNNPGMFLTSVSKHMNADTQLVLTTPNMYGLKFFLHSFSNIQAMDPDHSLGFSFSLLETLLTRHGFSILAWHTSVQRFPSRRNRIANGLFGFLFRLWPRYADTLIVVAKRRADSVNHRPE